jgi:hypothetical protein
VPTAARRRTLLGSVAIASVALLTWRPVNNDDTFMYLATGTWVADHRRIPLVDPFSWTYRGDPWQSTGWGWGLVLWCCHRIAGVAGVAAITPILVCVIGAGLVVCARRLGARQVPALVCAVAALLCISPWITDRAQISSYTIFPFALYVAVRATEHDRLNVRWLALPVVVQTCWINLHSAGLISVPYLAALLGGLVLDRFRARESHGMRDLLTVAWKPTIVLVVAVAALLANPWNVGEVTHAFATRSLSQSTISEWKPLLQAGPLAIVPVVVAVLAAAGFVAGRRRPGLRIALLLPCVVGAALAVDSIRNAPFLILVAAIAVPPALPAIRSRLARRSDLANLAVGTFGIFAIVVAATAVPDTGSPGPNIPVRSTAALPAHCKLRNKSDLGGYVMATRPDVPVSADGRNDLFGLPGYQQNGWFTGTRQEAEQGLRQIEREGTTCVLARPDSTIVSLLERAGWKVAGTDPGGVALVRPDDGSR